MLDDFLPRYDVNEVHSIAIDSPAGAVMDAVRALTASEVPVLVALMAIRSLPSVLRGRPRPPLRGALLDGFRKSGFVDLRDAPDELVLAAVGRFWEPSGGLLRIEPEQFVGFAEPGFAKGAFSLEIKSLGERALLTTETRVATTDERSRRSFARYWRVVHPGSALIRLAWLRAIRRRAERARS